jgi:two-component system, LuxR family, response regulator FixJ
MIYIIDDDKYVRKGFEILFKSAGLESTSCASAEEFIGVMKEVENDIILLDMHMPGMNGSELLNYLSEKELFYPVIIISAYDEPASREVAKKYGAMAYLRKPVDSEALIDLVRYAVNPV